MTTEKGNIGKGGWFIGDIENKDSLLSSQNCQIKWAIHPKGLKKVSGVELEFDVRSVVVLISGKWLTKFPERGEEVILDSPGDYLAYTGEYHENEALEESHVMVIRWDPKLIINSKQ